jgi:DNA-binding GntR family transcriptional regulator
VRESLERLSQEGYVRHVANRGYFVAEIDAQEVRDLYQTREALENYALKQLFARGVSSGLRARLDEINARYRRLCLESLSRERLLVDRDFHLALAADTGNLHLCRTLAGIFDRLILKRRVEGYHDTRGLVPYQDHVKLLEAIYAGNAKLAEQVLHDHIQSACTRFLAYLDAAAEPMIGR